MSLETVRLPVVKPTTFHGDCSCCGRYSEKQRGAVELDVDGGSTIHVCLRCARRLAKKLQAAVERCRTNLAAGLVYRHDKWKPRKRGRR